MVILGFKSDFMEQSKTTMVSSSDVQLYPEGRLGLGGIGVYESLDCYFYGGANSHKFCVDQRDHWVIKFKLRMNLFDLIKLRTPWGGYEKEGVR